MTLKSTYCGVAGNRFQTCMTSAAKTKTNIDLEITLLLILDKEMRHRPQLKFNSRCIAFQIASYLKKMFGYESRELSGSDSSQKSSDTMKRLIRGSAPMCFWIIWPVWAFYAGKVGFGAAKWMPQLAVQICSCPPLRELGKVSHKMWNEQATKCGWITTDRPNMSIWLSDSKLFYECPIKTKSFLCEWSLDMTRRTESSLAFCHSLPWWSSF
jgi:hypothetical protein